MDSAKTTEEHRPRARRGLLIAGLAVLGGSLIGIVHFVISGALAGFPITMVAPGRNWIFIGSHALLGVVGLVLLGLARTHQRPAPAPRGEPESTSAVDLY